MTSNKRHTKPHREKLFSAHSAESNFSFSETKFRDKYSRWMSCEPAVGDYIPADAESAKKLGGLGGVYNLVNMNFYHYGANNPLKYKDPTGMEDEVVKQPDPEMIDILNKQFAQKMADFVGTPYVFGGQSREGLDCSGTVIQALHELGYNVPDTNVAGMLSGDTDWLTISDGVDASKAGDAGMLNFYQWSGDDSPSHVNTGIGTENTPLVLLKPKKQIVDATEGATMLGREGRDGQYVAPGKHQVNQTFAPYSTKTAPCKQATLNWGVLNQKYKQSLYNVYQRSK